MTRETWVSRTVPKSGKVRVLKADDKWYEPWVVVLPHYERAEGRVSYSWHYFKTWEVAFQLAMDIQDSRNLGDLT